MYLTAKGLYSCSIILLVISQTLYCSGKYKYGEREIRKGPATFALYPSEVLVGTQSAVILSKNEAAIVFVDSDTTSHTAGERYMIVGPSSFIPDKNEHVESVIQAINVSDGQAIYVRNIENGELKMVKGPCSYLLKVNEEKYLKSLSSDEYEALGLTNRSPSYFATSIQVQKDEIACTIDSTKHEEKYHLGPTNLVLRPTESIKILSVSAGVPKRENAQKLAVVRLGPDFLQDQVQVRTKDNAVLNLDLSFKWKFIVDEQNYYKLFTGDFIGYACQSLRSRVRGAASMRTFEEFHTSSAEILRASIFKNAVVPLTVDGKKVTQEHYGRFFPEFNFLIFELDVKSVSAADAEIEELLDESIKSSMNIMVDKLRSQSEFQQQKEKIQSETEIAKLKRNLIEIENANLTKEKVEKAKIDGLSLIETAKAERDAAALLENASVEIDLQQMRQQIEMLKGHTGQKYIDYLKATTLHENVKYATVLPVDAKLFLQGAASTTAPALAHEQSEY